MGFNDSTLSVCQTLKFSPFSNKGLLDADSKKKSTWALPLSHLVALHLDSYLVDVHIVLPVHLYTYLADQDYSNSFLI